MQLPSDADCNAEWRRSEAERETERELLASASHYKLRHYAIKNKQAVVKERQRQSERAGDRRSVIGESVTRGMSEKFRLAQPTHTHTY